ncbi:MAG: hypothetical protein RLZZ362_621 [Actinomycetota bacterium]
MGVVRWSGGGRAVVVVVVPQWAHVTLRRRGTPHQVPQKVRYGPKPAGAGAA